VEDRHVVVEDLHVVVEDLHVVVAGLHVVVADHLISAGDAADLRRYHRLKKL